jgi:hypothetical protein
MNTNNTYQPPTSYYNLNSIPPVQNPPSNLEMTYPNLNTQTDVQIQPQPIICNNQCMIIQSELNIISTALRSNPQYIKCPFCNYAGITKSTKSYSIPNLLCCLCFGVAGWLGVQVLRGKDINCTDAEHSCMKCGHVLGNYQAC